MTKLLVKLVEISLVVLTYAVLPIYGVVLVVGWYADRADTLNKRRTRGGLHLQLQQEKKS